MATPVNASYPCPSVSALGATIAPMSVDEYEARQEQWLEDYFREQLQAQSEDHAAYYLSRNGDAVQERVDACRAEAQSLRAANFPGPSVVRAVTGIEVAIRFFLAMPLVQGAFLSDEWAESLTEKIVHPTKDNRAILPAILRRWGVDITDARLPTGDQMWEQVQRVWRGRNDHVHTGAALKDEDAKLALECLDALLTEVVHPIAIRLGFKPGRTGRWGRGTETGSPFRDGRLPTRKA